MAEAVVTTTVSPLASADSRPAPLTALGWVARVAHEARRFIIIPLLLAAWELAVRGGWLNGDLVPPPSAVLRALRDLAASGMLWEDIGASIQRVTIGFGIASTVGIASGLLLGRVRWLAFYILPLVDLVRPISVIAWIPLAILWFGLGDRPAWFIIALGAFFPIFSNAYLGAVSVAEIHLRVARCFGAGRWLTLRTVLLPSALPYILTGLRVGLGVGWMCVIAAELISSTSGLGYLIQLARTTIETEKVLAGMVVVGLLGLCMNGIMLGLERAFVRRQ